MRKFDTKIYVSATAGITYWAIFIVAYWAIQFLIPNSDLAFLAGLLNTSALIILYAVPAICIKILSFIPFMDNDIFALFIKQHWNEFIFLSIIGNIFIGIILGIFTKFKSIKEDFIASILIQAFLNLIVGSFFLYFLMGLAGMQP